MFPGISSYDVGNGRSGNAVISGDRPVSFSAIGAGADIPNVIISKLCEVVSIAAIHRSVSNFVEMVVFYCIPSQVIEMVIELVSVVVTSLHPVRSVANKRVQNEDVDKLKFVSERAVNPYPVIPAPLIVSLFQEV